MSHDKTISAMLKDIEIDSFLADQGYRSIAGVDEAGRGPLAGPVVAAAVIIPDGMIISGVDDSKKLSAAKREELFEEIAAREIPVAVGIIDSRTIDRINILQASLMAMHRAVCGLKKKPECLLVDGSFQVPNCRVPQMAIVGGDGRCQCIAAASIVAKVTRDRIMRQYAEMYPEFAFDEHCGYPTRKHLSELREHGPTVIHRRSFKPVAEVIAAKNIPQLAALI